MIETYKIKQLPQTRAKMSIASIPRLQHLTKPLCIS
jgi:hypothetical protein